MHRIITGVTKMVKIHSVVTLFGTPVQSIAIQYHRSAINATLYGAYNVQFVVTMV